MAEEKNEQERDEELEQENLDNEDDEEQDGSDDPYESLSEEEAKERLRKAEKAIEMSKKAEKKKPSRDINSEENDKFERLELKVSGYPDEVVDQIISLGGKEALNDPVKKKVIDEYTKQAKAEQAAEVESSSKSGVSKKYSKEELRQMSTKELEDAYKEMGL